MGTELLPSAWRDRAKRFGSRDIAELWLRVMRHDLMAMAAMRRLAKELTGPAPSAPAIPAPSGKAHKDDDTIRTVATALAAGSAWAIEARSAPKSRFTGKTDPAVFSVINPKYGTAVDFAYIASLEGDQWLRGYVPMQGGIVMGRSGMTVASGFDIGQWSLQQLRQFGFPQTLLDKIEPFADQPFKGMKKSEVAAAVAGLGPVPVLTKDEADLCDGAVFGVILSGALAHWDANRLPGVSAFKSLPAGWQTVWLSRNYQEGGNTHVPEGKIFRKAALAGLWKDAVAALRSYTQYRDRIGREAALLEIQLPPDPPQLKGKTPPNPSPSAAPKAGN